jgi:hypothetical protein
MKRSLPVFSESSETVTKRKTQQSDSYCEELDKQTYIRGERRLYVRNDRCLRHALRCPRCNRRFEHHDQTYAHFFEVHRVFRLPPERKFKCKLCPEKFWSNLFLMKHVKIHNPPEPDLTVDAALDEPLARHEAESHSKSEPLARHEAESHSKSEPLARHEAEPHSKSDSPKAVPDAGLPLLLQPPSPTLVSPSLVDSNFILSTPPRKLTVSRDSPRQELRRSPEPTICEIQLKAKPNAICELKLGTKPDFVLSDQPIFFIDFEAVEAEIPAEVGIIGPMNFSRFDTDIPKFHCFFRPPPESQINMPSAHYCRAHVHGINLRTLRERGLDPLRAYQEICKFIPLNAVLVAKDPRLENRILTDLARKAGSANRLRVHDIYEIFIGANFRNDVFNQLYKKLFSTTSDLRCRFHRGLPNSDYHCALNDTLAIYSTVIYAANNPTFQSSDFRTPLQTQLASSNEPLRNLLALDGARPEFRQEAEFKSRPEAKSNVDFDIGPITINRPLLRPIPQSKISSAPKPGPNAQLVWRRDLKNEPLEVTRVIIPYEEPRKKAKALASDVFRRSGGFDDVSCLLSFSASSDDDDEPDMVPRMYRR